MGNPQQRAARYEDLFALPENRVGEIITGDLHKRPRPAPRHALVCSSLTHELVGPFSEGKGGGPGGWWILDEPELHLGPDILVPDLAGWRRERLPALPETAWFELAPDWICEVLSPSTRRIDRVTKMPLYAASRIAYCWLVDPAVRTLEAFKLIDGQWLLLASFVDEAEVAAEPFDAVAFPLQALWAESMMDDLHLLRRLTEPKLPDCAGFSSACKTRKGAHSCAMQPFPQRSRRAKRQAVW